MEGFGPPILGVKMKWTKPSGLEIETNDKPVTIEYCKSLGWIAEGEEEGLSLEDMNSKQLDKYAFERFSIKLDGRKKEETLRAEVKALEDEHGN